MERELLHSGCTHVPLGCMRLLGAGWWCSMSQPGVSPSKSPAVSGKVTFSSPAIGGLQVVFWDLAGCVPKFQGWFG